MRDPFDDLKGLEGLSRPPLPAEEVRRRGDRLRRRRTALQAVGAAAAVALIASGGVLATGGETGTGPDIGPAERTGAPAPSPTAEAAEHTWITTLPDGFPLDWALPEPGGDVPEPEWDEGPGTALSAVACGENDALPAPPTDGLRVQVSPPDESVWRHLLLFENDTAATDARAALLSTAERCSEGQQGGTEDQLSPEEVRWSVSQSPRAETPVIDVEGAFYARGTDSRVPGRILTRVVQVGNALLVARRDSASSATGTDPEARAFTGDVDALADLMCVFSAAGCGSDRDDAADDLEPEPLPYAINPDTLTRHTGEAGWTSTQGILEQPMVCAEESTEALAGDRTDTRMYARFDDEGTTVGMATTTVLDFSPSTEATAAFDRATDWLTTCDEPLDRDHPVVDGGLGEVHSGSWTTGPHVWRTVTTAAPEICDDCDAVWHHHQGVALAGERLVIVQVSTPGKGHDPTTASNEPLPDLLQAAAGLAAGGTSSTDTFGPEGMGGLDLGTSTSQGPGAALVDVLGGARCQAFRLRGPGRPANNVDGFSEGERGVVVLFARTGMTTPQGVGLGSSRQDVLEAHPGGEDLVPGYRVAVDGQPGTHYQFGFEDGRVVSLILARDDQGCIG